MSNHDDYHAQRIATGAALSAKYPTLTLLPIGPRILSLHGVLRDERTDTALFVRTADDLIRSLMEGALDSIYALTSDAVDSSSSQSSSSSSSSSSCNIATRIVVTTPTQSPFFTYAPPSSSTVMCISIVRAGEIMETGLRSIILGATIGKILIQRDESTADKRAVFFYSKLPPNIATNRMHVLLCDPMLASGGSAICAIAHLITRGVTIDRITFVNLICCAPGIEALLTAYPTLRIVSQCLDPTLDNRKYIVPGVGDMGDRYFGTVEAASAEGHTTTNAEINAKAGGK